MSDARSIKTQTTTDASGTITTEHRGPGSLVLENENGQAGRIRLEAADGRGEGVEILGPASMGTSYQIVYPGTAPTAGQVLEVGSVSGGVVNMGWATAETPIPIGETLQAADGSNAAPGFTFASDTNTGMYLAGADNLSFSTGGTNCASFLRFLGNVYATLNAASFIATASTLFQLTAPSGVVIVGSTGTGGTLVLREGTSGGSNEIRIGAPATLAANRQFTIADNALADGAGFLLGATSGGTSGEIRQSIWANAVPITVAENGLLSTSTASGYQFSTGDGGTGYQGVVLPFSGLIVGMSIGVAATTVVATIQAAVNGASLGASYELSIAGGSRRYHTTFGTPYAVSAGDAVSARTTAVTTSGQQNTVTIWVVPTE